MSAITSLYIPNIQKEITAEFIAFVFERNLIAQVSRVAIEYNKKNKKYYAFVEIRAWYDTETAYNFITRLKNPYKETRFIYRDDEWWIVEINKFPHKLTSSKHPKGTCVSRALTIFDRIDVDRTILLKNILFGHPVAPDSRMVPTFDDEDIHHQDPDLDLEEGELRQDQDQDRDQDRDLDQDARDFDDYLRDIHIERQLIVYEMNYL
jgi:hypothetical protein